MMGHLPISAATGLAVTEVTSSPALGLVAAATSHYVIDGISPWQQLTQPNQLRIMDWLGDEKNLLKVGATDCLVGWGMITLIGLLFHQSWFFWLFALMGFWPDLDKAPVFGKIFKLWPLNWLAQLHERLHWWRTTNALVVIPGWLTGIVISYLVLWWVIQWQALPT